MFTKTKKELIIPDARKVMVEYFESIIQLHNQVLRECEVRREQRKQFKRYADRVEIIKRMLAAGFEPTTPPAHWYVGAYKGLDSYFNLENWPQNRRDIGRYDAMRFSSPVPNAVVLRYKKARSLGIAEDDVVVYSPNRNDFTIRAQVIADPIMIGTVWIPSENPVHFEIGHWDLSKDLQKTQT